MSDSEKGFDALCGIFISLAAIATSMVARGWAASTLWGWFVVPLGVPAIGWAHAAGLSGLVAFASFDHTVARRERKESDSHTVEALAQLAYALCVPALAVLFGWLIARWM